DVYHVNTNAEAVAEFEKKHGVALTRFPIPHAEIDFETDAVELVPLEGTSYWQCSFKDTEVLAKLLGMHPANDASRPRKDVCARGIVTFNQVAPSMNYRHMYETHYLNIS